LLSLDLHQGFQSFDSGCVDADASEYFVPELANAGVTLFEGRTHCISMRRQVRTRSASR